MCICISVISKIHLVMSLYKPYCYTLIYMSLFINSSFVRVGKVLGGGGGQFPI